MEKIKLGDIASVITKGTTPTSIGFNFTEQGINFIKIESITEDGSFINDKFAHISEECYSRLKRSQIKENDILFSIAGAIGRVAVVNNEILPANTNQALAIIRVDDRYDKEFLTFLLRSSFITKQYNKRKQGVAQINLSLKDISELEIPIIDINKQLEIKENLKNIIKIISLRKKQLEDLNNIIKSQFVEMFENENKYVNLEDVCVFINGDRGKNYPSADKISKDPSGIPFINAGLLINNTVDWKNMNYISEDTYNKLGSGKIQKEDILYCLRGSLGKHSIIDFDGKGAIASSLVILRADKSKIQPDFLLIQLGMDEIIRQQNLANNGSSQPNLSASSVKKYRIKLPDIEMQNKFVNIVKQIDKQKFVLQKSYISMMKLLKCLRFTVIVD